MKQTMDNEEDINENQKSKRTEEVSDIIETMPMTFGRWAAGAVCLFAGIFFLFGWLIKYPDIVSGEIVISSSSSPVKLIANASGKIHLLHRELHSEIKEGDYIAVIKNNACTENIIMVQRELNNFNLNNFISGKKCNIPFSEKISLGELDSKYYLFLAALRNILLFYNDNSYVKQINTLKNDFYFTKSELKYTDEAHLIALEKMRLSQKWYERYKGMNKEVVSTYEQEIDNRGNEYLSLRENEKSLQKEMVTAQKQMQQNIDQISLLETEKRANLKDLQLNVLATFHDLKDELAAWENKYVLKAPFAGELEQLDFIEENLYVQEGTPVFALVPPRNKLLGKMYLPASGAGKVKRNDQLNIKLQDYPYTEYGSIEGRVNTISLISTSLKGTQDVAGYYLLTVNLPNGLTTNFTQKLPFKHNMIGNADIIVKERRLINRLFDNLNYSVK